MKISVAAAQVLLRAGESFSYPGRRAKPRWQPAVYQAKPGEHWRPVMADTLRERNVTLVANWWKRPRTFEFHAITVCFLPSWSGARFDCYAAPRRKVRLVKPETLQRMITNSKCESRPAPRPARSQSWCSPECVAASFATCRACDTRRSADGKTDSIAS